MVDVEFNIDCREYQGKYYTNLSCWRCDKVTIEETTAVQMGDDSDDDLPF